MEEGISYILRGFNNLNEYHCFSQSAVLNGKLMDYSTPLSTNID